MRAEVADPSGEPAIVGAHLAAAGPARRQATDLAAPPVTPWKDADRRDPMDAPHAPTGRAADPMR